MFRLLALLLFATACAPTDGTGGDTDTASDSDTPDTGTPGDTGTPTDTGTPGDTGETADTGAPADTSTPADTSDSGDTADTGTPTGPISDACDNTADVGVLGTATNIDSVSQTCTTGCIATPPLGACAAECIETELGLTDACADCFGAYSACLVSNCALFCINPSSNLCQTCLANNCNGAFETCAGVALP